jgi:uncharacterized protein YkwD
MERPAMSQPTRAPLPDATDDVFLKELLDSINVLRARHGVEPLTLDPELVTYAKARARTASSYEGLAENHAGNKGSGYGENMSLQQTMSDQPAPTSVASSSWYGEIVDYDFPGAKSYQEQVTGHFTQLVWKGSTKFGAARAFGKGTDYYETYIVANFSPAGNMGGEYATNVVAPTKGQGDAATLRWASFDGTTWSPVTLLSDHQSSHGPAVAMFDVFGETLYCVHRGSADTALRCTTWDVDTPIPHCETAVAPGLAVHENRLYCAYLDTTSDAQLQYTRFNGMSWTGAAPIGGRAGAGPALAVYRGKLYCAHRGPGSDARIWFTCLDGKTWATDTPIPVPDCDTEVVPALAVYRDELYCAHRGNDGYVRYTVFDGTSWRADRRVSDIVTSSGPSLAVYRDKLYCGYRGRGDNLRYVTFDGTAWSPSATVPGGTTTKNPALAVHHDRLYFVHRG